MSVTRLHVPLPVMITVLVFMLGGVVSVTLVWGKTTEHRDDKHVHIDETEAIQGGGVAFKSDVAAVRTEFEQKMTGEYQKTRKMLKAMTIGCTTKHGALTCKVDLPEPD
jgi:hypothetical protein